MEGLKKIKWDMIASSAIFVVVGVILIIFPTAVNEMMAYILAAAMFLISVVQFYNYFKKNVESEFYRNDLVVAVITLVLGIVLLAKREAVISIIPLLFGIVIIISGVKKLQNAFDLLRLKLDGWLSVLVLSIINIVFGIIMVINAFEVAKVVTILMGVGLVYSGATDLFSAIWITSCAKKCGKQNDDTTDLVVVDDTKK